MNFCKCGCGELVKQNYKHGHGRRGKTNSEAHNFAISKANSGKPMPKNTKKAIIAFHTGRIVPQITRELISKTCKQKGIGKWMVGRKLSPEAREKMISSKKGHLTSQETRQKISLANSGEKNGMYGTIITPEQKQKTSEFMKKQFADKDFREKMRTYWESDEFKRHCRKSALTTILTIMRKGYTDTKPEKEMKKILDKLQIEYETQRPIIDIEHCFASDFFIHPNIIIEVDGTYWHNYPDGRELDHIRNSELEKAGYKIIRFWEDMFTIEDVKTKLMEKCLWQRQE